MLPVQFPAALCAAVCSVLALAACGSRLRRRRGCEQRPEDPRGRHPRLLGDVEGGARRVQEEDRHHREGRSRTGDAGELTNKLVLTKDSPLADGVYGIDNTFASRAVDEGVLLDYTPTALPASAEPFRARRRRGATS